MLGDRYGLGSSSHAHKHAREEGIHNGTEGGADEVYVEEAPASSPVKPCCHFGYCTRFVVFLFLSLSVCPYQDSTRAPCTLTCPGPSSGRSGERVLGESRGPCLRGPGYTTDTHSLHGTEAQRASEVKLSRRSLSDLTY